MSPSEFTLKTLRQANGAMRQPRTNTKIADRQVSVVRLLLDHEFLSLAQLANALDMNRNSLSGTITLMVERRLLERIGDCGDYRYAATDAGRALCA